MITFGDDDDDDREMRNRIHYMESEMKELLTALQDSKHRYIQLEEELQQKDVDIHQLNMQLAASFESRESAVRRNAKFIMGTDPLLAEDDETYLSMQ